MTVALAVGNRWTPQQIGAAPATAAQQQRENQQPGPENRRLADRQIDN
jgi:hypothetical protein